MKNSSNNIGQRWERLSARERRLFTGVLALVILMVLYLGCRGALNYLKRLDAHAMQLEDELVNFTFQLARKDEVVSRWAEIASQHSSAWSEAEIADRLRLEIYRLAQKKPAQLNEEGIPLTAGGGGGNLVEIPRLGEGSLLTGGEGYREYQLRFDLPPDTLPDVLTFLSRLHESPQALRVDKLVLRRAPEMTDVSAEIVLTRTVVAGLPEGLELETVTGAAQLGEEISLLPTVWQTTGATLTSIGGASPALTIVAAADEAVAFYPFPTLPEQRYELVVDASAQGSVRVSIGASAGVVAEQALPADGGRYVTTARVTSGLETALEMPRFTLSTTGDSLTVYAVRVRAVTE